MPLALALGLALLLIATDLVVRALRIQLFVRGAGHRLSFRDVFTLNTFGDAAAVVTPLRIGGEAARLGGLLFGGVPVATAIPLLALEMISYSLVVAATASLFLLLFAPGWWTEVGPGLTRSVSWALPWLAAVAVASVLVWWIVRRRRRGHAAAPPRPRLSWSSIRGALGLPLLASIPLTVISVVCRVGVLPVLAQTLPSPPALPVLALSSFALIYGQLFLPTPGGAGAVELAFSSGAAGELGGSLGTVFLAWRACTTGLPVVLGFALAIPRYGGAAVRRALRGRHPHGDEDKPAEGPPAPVVPPPARDPDPAV